MLIHLATFTPKILNTSEPMSSMVNLTAETTSGSAKTAETFTTPTIYSISMEILYVRNARTKTSLNVQIAKRIVFKDESDIEKLLVLV